MPTKEAKELVQTIFTLKRFLFAYLQNKTKNSPERMIQFEALSYIHNQKRPKMKDLAQFFGITPPSITCMIDKLEHRHLLMRSHDKEDRRNIYLKLTREGIKFLQVNQKQLESTIIDFLSPLNENDKKDLINIYKKLFTHYENKK